MGKKVKLRYANIGGYPSYSVGIPPDYVATLGWKPKDKLDATLDTERRAIIIRKAEE